MKLLRTILAVMALASACCAQTTQPSALSALLAQAPAAEAADQQAAVSAATSAQKASDAAALAAAQATLTQQAASITQLQQQLQAATTQPSSGHEQHFGVNLESLTYYCRGQVFADAMLQAQNFYSGADVNQNPTANQQTIVFGQATANLAGDYKFICTGQPTLVGSASYATVSNLAYNAATNTTTADVAITAQQLAAIPQMCLSIGNVVSGKVSNIQLWRPGTNVGVDRFNPAFITLLNQGGFDTIRFMDFLGVNGSTQVNWTDRPLPTDRNYTLKGGCYEDCFALCKQTGKTPWICLPTQATPAYLGSFMAMAQQQGGTVYPEWGNEIWNSAFPQWNQAMALAKADATLAYDGTGDPNILLYRWMGKQAVLVGKAAMARYGVNDIRLCPIRPILAGQWGNSDVLRYALAYIASQYGPPNQYIYGIAIAPYATLSPSMSTRIQTGDPTVTEQQIVADYAAFGAENSGASNALVAAFVAQAKQYSLHTRAYEFGFDSGQAQQDVAQKIAAAHDPAIGPILTTYVNNWWAAGCEGLNWFTLTAADTSNGQWGLTADTYDPTPPKFVAAAAAAQATLATH